MLATYFTIAFRYVISFCLDLFFGLLLLWIDFKGTIFDIFDFKQQLTIQEKATIFIGAISAAVIFIRFLANFEEYRRKRIERKKVQYDFEKQKEIDLINLNKENEQRENNKD